MLIPPAQFKRKYYLIITFRGTTSIYKASFMGKHHIRNWFLSPYRDASLEVRKKMQFLVMFGILVFFIFIIFLIVNYFRGDHSPLALIFVRQGQPERAVNCLMLTLAATFISAVVVAYFSEWPLEEIREFIPFIINAHIFQTTLILIFELLVISLFALKKYQLKVFIGASFFTVTVLYIVLVVKLNNGNIFDWGVFPFFQLLFLVFSSIVAYLILSLSKALLTIAERHLREAEDHEKIKKRYEKRQEGDKKHWEYEVRARLKEPGEEKIVNLSTTVLNYYGKPAIMGTCKDVTEKRRAEEALRSSEQVNYDLDGRKINSILHLNVLPGYEENLERVIITLVDITARKEAEEELMKRDKMLSGATKAVDRAYVYENSLSEDEDLLFSMKYEWTSREVTPEINNPEGRNKPYSEGFARWQYLFTDGKPVVGADTPRKTGHQIDPPCPDYRAGDFLGFRRIRRLYQRKKVERQRKVYFFRLCRGPRGGDRPEHLRTGS